MKIGMIVCVSPLDIPYMKEWVQYHRSIGVQDFYMALNDWSAFDMVEFRKMFWRGMSEGWIHTVRIDGYAVQFRALDETLNMANKDCDWAISIDIDEFLRIRHKVGEQPRSLDSILQGFNSQPCLSINWRLYGSNGLESVVDGDFSVMKRFVKCGRFLNQHVKPIVNLGYFKDRNLKIPKFRTAHYLGCTSVSQDGNLVYGPFNTNRLDHVHELEIAHYVTKSREECRVRRSFRRSDTGVPREEGWEEFFRQHDINEVNDAEINME